jgi:outer membrane protein assembly factor BamE (lipoprotein component of BamABCDE complex)
MKLLFIIASIAVLFVLGCATVNTWIGKDFDQTKTSQILKDKSNKNDITKLFGEPYTKTQTPDKEIWKYFYQQIKTSAQTIIVTTVQTNTEIKSLEVVFENNIVKDYSYTFQPFQKK